MNASVFEIVDMNNNFIKVIGVGGAGGNTLDHMIRSGIGGVEYIYANTDAQALGRSLCNRRIQLGATGLGAGAKPEVGRQAAEDSREQIAASLEGAKLLFIAAGMGGGTGTGAAPVVARIAREMNIMTVAVVTKPFEFENGKRMDAAEMGIAELEPEVHSLIVILNEKLNEVLGGDVGVSEAFHAVDNVLCNAVGGIAEIINKPGLVNVDFEDVRTVMEQRGIAMMGTGQAGGVDRARRATELALSSPLLEGVQLSGARGVLVSITASQSLKMKEVREVMDMVRTHADDSAHVIFGSTFDEQMKDDLKVTVVATGLSRGLKIKIVEPVSIPARMQRTGTHDMSADASTLEHPAVMRSHHHAVTADAMQASGIERYDIPAFLRKQAD